MRNAARPSCRACSGIHGTAKPGAVDLAEPWPPEQIGPYSRQTCNRHSRAGGNPYWQTSRHNRDHSSIWVPASDTVAPLLGIAPEAIVYVAQGCEDCNQTGYKGRIGVFEAVRIDDTIRRLINTDGHESEITAHAFAKSPNLAQSARDLVLTGQTTAEEAVRVSRRDTTEAVPEVTDA